MLLIGAHQRSIGPNGDDCLNMVQLQQDFQGFIDMMMIGEPHPGSDPRGVINLMIPRRENTRRRIPARIWGFGRRVMVLLLRVYMVDMESLARVCLEDSDNTVMGGDWPDQEDRRCRDQGRRCCMIGDRFIFLMLLPQEGSIRKNGFGVLNFQVRGLRTRRQH